MKLSEYAIALVGVEMDPFRPFEAFGDPRRKERSPAWYRDYNAVKHHRLENFRCANLKNVIYSAGGVFVLICAQYADDFDYQVQFDYSGDLNNHPDLFQVVGEPKWCDEEKYDYNPLELFDDPEPFEYHPLPVIGDK